MPVEIFIQLIDERDKRSDQIDPDELNKNAMDKVSKKYLVSKENPHLIFLIMRVSFQRPMSHPCK